MNITPFLVQDALSRHVGREKGVRADRLVVEILGQWSARHERRLRKVVEQLRKEGSHICAHPSTGYFMAADAGELDRYYIKFLKARAMASLEQIARAKKIALPELLGQLRLNT